MQNEDQTITEERRRLENLPFYQERKTTGFDGMQYVRIFQNENDSRIKQEIALYLKRGWVIKRQGYRTSQGETAYVVEFTPKLSHKISMSWKKIKWKLFGETRIFVWYLIGGVLLSAGLVIGGISFVTWLVIKIAQHVR